MRLIDADAFKNYIRSALEDMRHLFKDNGEWAKEVTESFCKDIDEQPTIELPHWIPCSERLPEKDGYYLTSTMYRQVYGDYWNGDNFDRTEMVIAWQSLPEPYEPDEQYGQFDRHMNLLEI